MPAKDAQMIGRGELMTSVISVLHDIHTNKRNRAILVVGEEACGRSFFMEQVEARAIEQGWAIAKGKCEDTAKNNPYQPFFSALGLRFDDKGQIVRDYRVASLVDQFMLDTVTTALTLLPIIPGAQVITLGVKIGKAIYQKYSTAGTEQEKANRNFEFIRQVLQQVIEKEKKPVMLAVDDIQHATVTTFALFRHLMEALPEGQFSLIVTWQLSPGQPFARLHEYVPAPLLNNCHVIGLRPLTHEETEQLVRQVLGSERAITQAQCDRIYEFSRGLPDLVVEAATMVEDEAPDLFDETDVKPGVALNAQAQALTARHLKDIPPEGLGLLEAAACMGRKFRLEPFSYDPLLKYLGITERQTYRLFSQMIASGSVLQRVDERYYEFTSDYLWVYLRGDLNSPISNRDGLHLAQALEVTVHDAQAGELAQAFYAGGDYAKAQDYAVRAARLLRAQGAIPEAIQSYRLALDALYHVPSTTELVRTRIQLFKEAGDVAEQMGAYQVALNLLNEAAPLTTGDATETADLASHQGWIHHLMGDDSTALATIGRGIQMCLAAGDETRAARCEYYRGSIYLAMRNWGKALACFEHYIDASHRLDLSEDLDLVYMEMGYIYRHQERFEEAENAIGNGLVMAEKQNDPLALSRGYHYLGMVYTLEGKPEAQATLEKAQELARGATHSPQREAMVLNSLAELHMQLGHPDLAAEALKASRRIIEDLKDPTNLALNIGSMAELYHQRWEHSTAIDQYNEVLKMLETDKDADLQAAWIHRYLVLKGDVHLLAGQVDEAEEAFKRAEAHIAKIADETSQQEASGNSLLAWVRLYLARNDIANAHQAIHKFNELCGSNTRFLARVATLHAEIARLEGKLDEAEQHLDKARVRWEQRGRTYDRMLVYYDLARLSRTRRDMKAANEWARKAATLANSLGNAAISQWASKLDREDVPAAYELESMRVQAQPE